MDVHGQHEDVPGAPGLRRPHALIAFVVVDYITGVMCAAADKKLSSEVGFKGIAKKVLIFLLVGIANILDVQVIGTGSVLRTAIIFFYISNEGVSLLENAGHLGQKENPDGRGWAAGAGYGEKILSILKGILGTAGNISKPAPAETEIWYRVRKSWADASSQKGAFKSLENAKKCADENPGHSVFDESGKAVYTRAAAFQPYLVRVSIPDLNIRKGPGTAHAKTGKYTGVGTFTIVEETDGKGASKWGLLKSYQEKRNGWVSLDYAERV